MTVFRIVVGYDYSPLADRALERAFEIASVETHAEVHVAAVILLTEAAGAELGGVPIQSAASVDTAHAALETRVKDLYGGYQAKTARAVGKVVTHIRSEAPAAEIAQLAVDLEARLIIVGTHGRRGVTRLLLGSVAEGVVRLAHCEVLVVRTPEVAPDVPKIEPPCPRCVAERQATDGAQYWCSQHRERHGQRHTYHYENRAAQDGNMSGLYGTR